MNINENWNFLFIVGKNLIRMGNVLDIGDK